MIKIKTKGPWRQVRSLLRNYDQRWKYVQRQLTKDVAEAFLGQLKVLAPKGPEYDAYIGSLEVVELTGTKGKIVFGVISSREKVSLGVLAESNVAAKTVVYIQPKTTGEPSAVAQLMAEVNPWPLELIPHGLDSKTVTLVHQTVTEGEYTSARVTVMEFIHGHRSSLQGYGVQWGKTVSGERRMEELESLPDWMSLAIRAEFGINADLKPHWRPSVRWVEVAIREIIKGDEKIQGALFDSSFTEHTLTLGGDVPSMSAKKFEKETGTFQEKVVGK
jgi:hypothetical protein